MKKIKVETRERCLIWHRWKLVKNTGFSQYHECKDCGSRIAMQPDGGYQPINYAWVLRKTDTV